jgi:hypothetical protein
MEEIECTLKIKLCDKVFIIPLEREKKVVRKKRKNKKK